MTKNESEKLRKLYEIYEQPMYRIAYAVLKSSDRAEDAVSEAFIRIMQKISRLGEADSEKTKRYILKTIKNTSIDQYRKYKHFYEKVMVIDDEAVQIPDNSIDVESKIMGEESIRLLDDLNETDRQIIIMRGCNDMPWREVASRLSMTEANARKRFERARKKIIKVKGESYDE